MTTSLHDHEHDTFRHEALFYAGLDDFRDHTVDFIRQGLDADEHVLVVVGAAKLAMLRAELGGNADGVLFADMADVGRNPACIIPVWQEFVAGRTAEDRRVRGIGEPAYAGRTPNELAECRRHEFLLNVAFADSPGWRLLCPYDTTALDPAVIADARRTHPFVMAHGRLEGSDDYDETGPQRTLREPLPEPPGAAVEMAYGPGRLDDVRRFVLQQAAAGGLGRSRVDDLVLAVHEAAANSLRHAGGRGTLRLWVDAGAVVCEVRDDGVIEEQLVGRVRPGAEQESGRGLWLVNQLCDLVQMRSTAEGSVVRMHMAL